MKHKFPFFVLALVLAFSQLAAAPVVVSAQTSPWGEFFDADGNLLPNVTDMGEVEITPAPDWWPDWVPGAINFVPTYHQYISPNGTVLLAPSASTLFIMALDPAASGLTASEGFLANGGTTILLSLMGATQSGQELLAQMEALGFTDPELFADALISGDPAFSFLFDDVFRILSELYLTGAEDHMFATIYLLYQSCSNTPTGCPAELCLIAPLACDDGEDGEGWGENGGCAAPSATLGNPATSIAMVAPANPLVVGQDPERRGADVQIQVSIPPTVYTYYVPIPVYEEVTECYAPEDPANYAGTLDCQTTGSPVLNGYWRTQDEIVDVTCEEHIEVYPEPISNITANAILTGASQQWIEQGLGSYYYGAAVYQNSYSLIPGMMLASSGCDASKTCFANAAVPGIQFRDPGFYSLQLRVSTAGTPVTTGRLFSDTGEMSVSMISVRLIETGQER